MERSIPVTYQILCGQNSKIYTRELTYSTMKTLARSHIGIAQSRVENKVLEEDPLNWPKSQAAPGK